MRSVLRVLLTTGVFAVAAAPASANVACVLPVGPGGADMRLTLTVDACPAEGEAIPREWIVAAEPVAGAARPATSAPAATAPARAAATPVVRARVVHDVEPARGVRVAYAPGATAATTSAGVPQARSARAIAPSSAPAPSAETAPATPRSGSGPVPGVPTWMLLVLAGAVLVAIVAGPRTLGTR